jgi:hypothetical protein
LRASILREGKWEVRDLNASLPPAVSDPAGATLQDTQGGSPTISTRHLFYVGDDGDVHELRSNAAGLQWTHSNITATIAGVVRPRSGAALSAYAFQAGVHVVYRGIDDRIHELWGGPGTWNHNPTGVPFTKAAGEPSGYATEWASIQHIVYRGEEDEVVELWWNATTGWSENILSKTTPQASLSKGDAVGYPFEDHATQHVTYFADDDTLRELWWEDSLWRSASYDLDNPFPDNLGPLAAPFFYEELGDTFFVEPTVVETAVHEWSEWLPAREDVGWISNRVLPINPDPAPLVPSELGIVKSPAFVNSILPRDVVLLTARGTVGKILETRPSGTPDGVSNSTPMSPTKLMDLRRGLPMKLGADVQEAGAQLR